MIVLAYLLGGFWALTLVVCALAYARDVFLARRSEQRNAVLISLDRELSK